MATLSSICSRVCSGGTPKSTESSFYGGGIPWLNTKEIDFNVIESTERTITQAGLDNSSAKWVDAPSVIVAMYGATAGKVAISKIRMTTNQACCNLNIDPVKADYRFVYYALKNDYTRLSSMANGGAQQNLNAQQIKDFEIPDYSYSEQKKIADILSSLDEKIETNRKINARLEELAQAIFKSWFIDFEPFGGQMPEDWEEDSIYRYVDVIYGAPYKSELFNNDGNGLPLIRIRDLKTNIPQIYTTEILPNTEYINPGNIVVGMDAEFEPYFWFGEKGLLNQRVCKFKSKCEEVGNSFILYLTQPKLRFVQSYKVGTTVSHLGKSDIDKFRFIYPPLEVIENFTKISEPILERRIELSKESSRLAALRDTLLPKLMSGELIPE